MAARADSFAKEQKRFLRTCAEYLPGPSAKKAFEQYALSAIEDYRANCPGTDFAQAAQQIGTGPYDAAQSFLESQPPQTLALWQKQAARSKKCKIAAVVAVILVLAGIVAFYFKTNGVLIVNTKTTMIDFDDSDLSEQEQADLLLEALQKEELKNG